MVADACCMPMKAAAKLLTNRALLPVEDLDTTTCATVVPAGNRRHSSGAEIMAQSEPLKMGAGCLEGEDRLRQHCAIG